MKKKTHLPCKDCGSSDALVLNEDGSTYCFSCKTFKQSADEQIERIAKQVEFKETKQKNRYPVLNPLSWRGLTSEVIRFYGCGFPVFSNGNTSDFEFVFNYENGQKCRVLKNKFFYWRGHKGTTKLQLFGSKLFSGGKVIWVTEGETDAMSVHQMTGHASVSIAGGISTAVECLRHNYDYLMNFSKVVLFFDNDEHGKYIANKSVEEFPNFLLFPNKTNFKDANEFLTNGGQLYENQKRQQRLA